MSKLHQALLAAQSEMGGAQKTATNPHFRSQYADLESVQKACFPQLHRHGIVVLQIPGKDETGLFLETMFIHGESGESVSNFVPVMMTKQDAQGYGSGLTYARRYGLMSLAGLAPTDDDGNAACEPVGAVQPVGQPVAQPVVIQDGRDRPNVEEADSFGEAEESLNSYEVAILSGLFQQLDEESQNGFLKWAGVLHITEVPGAAFNNCKKALQAKLRQLATA